jgi:hypothetical protein
MRRQLSISNAAAAWWTLAILSGLNLLNYLDRYVMSAVITPMQKELSLSDGDAGWAASSPRRCSVISAIGCRENT